MRTPSPPQTNPGRTRSSSGMPTRRSGRVSGVRVSIGGLTNIANPLIGQDCDCSTCGDDPTISCQFTGDYRTVVSAYIDNAEKGNLLLCPGSGAGVIGGLLHSLQPPQHFSHMGIFTYAKRVVRHSCGIEDRISADEYATGSVFGSPAPLDGFEPDKLRHFWPGTVSQTVLQALKSSRADPSDPGKPLLPCSLTDQDSSQSPKATYNIDGLSFDPIVDPQADTKVYPGDHIYPPGTVFPLIVRPCRQLQTTPVTEALQRVADQAVGMDSHYRFFSYTQGYIGAYPDWYGPTTVVPVPDPAAAFPGSPDPFFPTDPNAPPATRTAPFTHATVCSSFVWTAVQLANASNLGPKIILDAATVGSRPVPTPGCDTDGVVPDWYGGNRNTVQDGLYRYTNAERQLAAQALYDKLKDKVTTTMSSKVPPGVLDTVKVFSEAALAAAVASGPVALAELLGIDKVTGANLYEALFDMPDDVANQMCNTFASDYAEDTATDSDNWRNPGSVSPDHLHVTPEEGEAVSPDDILQHWSPPTLVSNQIVGIYGYNERIVLRVGTFQVPICKWQPSSGTATIRGTVRYKGEPRAGVQVSACCEQTLSQGPRAFYELAVPAGRYLITASTYDPATHWGLDAQVDTGGLAAGSWTWLDIDLQDPPPQRRQLIACGTMDLTDVYLTGHDVGTFAFTCPPLYAELVSDAAGNPVANKIVTYGTGSASIGDTNAKVEVWLDDVKDDLSITGHFVCSLPDDKVSWGTPFTIAADDTAGWDVNLDTGGLFPDRATVHLKITNVRQN